MIHKQFSVSFCVVLLLVVSAGTIAAETSTDTATLNLEGMVPSLVRIGFGSVDTDTHTHDFEDLTDPATMNLTLSYLANIPFDITVSSENGGVLVLDGDAEGLGETIDYTLTFNGTNVFDNDGRIVEGGARGIGSGDLVASVTAVDFDGIDENTPETEIPAAGTYEDTITFTITAE